MSKTFARHMAALKSGLIGPTFIRGVRNAMHRLDRERRGYSVGAKASGMTLLELETINKAISESPPLIEPVQSEKGLTWLRSRRVQKELGERERRIVADYDHFRLVGWHDASNSYRAFMIPVYRVVDKHNNQFDYYTGSWQSGVALKVVN